MRSLSRKKAYRKSTLRNLATSLIIYEEIKTTEAKAKEVKPIVEHLLNIAKKEDLGATRRLMGYLFDKNATKKILEDLLPRYKNIKSGFIKEYKLSPRLGDGAKMTILELIKGESIVKEKVEKVENGKKSAKTTDKKVDRKTIKKTESKISK